MKLVFRVASGVIIGLLLVQIYVHKSNEAQAEKYRAITDKAQSEEDRRRGERNAIREIMDDYQRSIDAITNYYHKKRIFPQYAEEVICTPHVKCILYVKDGWFYGNTSMGWYRLKPYLNERKTVDYECDTNIRDVLPWCEYTEAGNWPDENVAETGCGDLKTEPDKLICQSEALAASRTLMQEMYENALQQAVGSDAEKIRTEQEDFRQELSRCDSKKCLEIKIRERAYELGAGDGTEAFFVDEDLQRCVRSELAAGLPFTWSALSDVIKVECNGKNIVSVAGIEHMISLKYVFLSDNMIEDASPVGRLFAVEKLSLENNSISDISFVSGMDSLKTLFIKGNSIKDISYLTSLDSLASVYIDDRSDYDCLDLQRLVSKRSRVVAGKADISDCDGNVKLTARRYAGIECNASATGAAVCGSGLLRFYDKEIVHLYAEVMQGHNSYIYLQRTQDTWVMQRDECRTLECLSDAYLARLNELYRLKRAINACKVNDAPLLARNSQWLTSAHEDESFVRVARYGRNSRKATFYTELYGAAGTTVKVAWYKSGRQVKEEIISLKDDRAILLSTNEINDHSFKWLVKISTEAGCEIVSMAIPFGENTREHGQNSQIKSDNEKYAAEYMAIVNNKEAQPGMVRAAARGREFLTARNLAGDTPLLAAIKAGNNSALNALLEDGASPYVWDSQGRSAFDIAMELGHQNIAVNLREVMKKNVPKWIAPYTTIAKQGETSPVGKKPYKFTEFDTPLNCMTRTISAKGHVVSHVWEIYNNDEKKKGYPDWIPVYASSITVGSDSETATSRYKLPEESALWRVNVYLDQMHLQTVMFEAHQPEGESSFNNKPPQTFSDKPETIMAALANSWAPDEIIGDVMDHTRRGRGELNAIVASQGNIRTIKYLMRWFDQQGIDDESRRDPRIRNIPVWSPMFSVATAIKNSRYDVLEYSLASGVRADSKIEGGRTPPLTLAVEYGDIRAVQMLLEYNATVDITDARDYTPLQLAADKCDYDIAALLLAHGAERLRMNSEQKSVYDIANERHCRPTNEWRSLLAAAKNETSVR